MYCVTDVCVNEVTDNKQLCAECFLRKWGPELLRSYALPNDLLHLTMQFLTSEDWRIWFRFETDSVEDLCYVLSLIPNEQQKLKFLKACYCFEYALDKNFLSTADYIMDRFGNDGSLTGWNETQKTIIQNGLLSLLTRLPLQNRTAGAVMRHLCQVTSMKTDDMHYWVLNAYPLDKLQWHDIHFESFVANVCRLQSLRCFQYIIDRIKDTRRNKFILCFLVHCITRFTNLENFKVVWQRYCPQRFYNSQQQILCEAIRAHCIPVLEFLASLPHFRIAKAKKCWITNMDNDDIYNFTITRCELFTDLLDESKVWFSKSTNLNNLVLRLCSMLSARKVIRKLSTVVHTQKRMELIALKQNWELFFNLLHRYQELKEHVDWRFVVECAFRAETHLPMQQLSNLRVIPILVHHSEYTEMIFKAKTRTHLERIQMAFQSASR